MIDIPFVQSDQLKKARDMEQVVLEFPSSVVEFVGVRVEPVSEEEPTYYVTVGCPALVDPKLVASAAYMRLRGQWRQEKLNVSAFQGITRRHESAELTMSY